MTISVVSCKKREIKKKISELINFVGWEPKKNSTVLLKPNLCAIKPKNESEITEPLIIEAIINFLKGFNCKIIIAETNNLGPSDKSYTFDDIIRNSGYRRFEKYENVTIVDLEKGPIIKKKIRGVTLEIPDLMNSVDHYINIAKIKTHFVTEVSLCLKNQMGIVPEPERMRYHREDLDKNIAYLSTVLKPDLCIVDGIVGMEGKGPHWGKSKKSNILIAGTNIVETDSITSALIGIDPSTVKHLKLAKDIEDGKSKPNGFGLIIK